MNLERMEVSDLVTQGVKTESNGDVVFQAVAVDKQKKPNRRGFMFDWDKPEDVHLENFMSNPVMFFQHDSEQLPIGMWEGMDVNTKRVLLSGRIPNLSDDPEMADFDREVVAPVRGAIKKGLLRAVSIGFYLGRHEMLDDDEGPRGVKVKEFELVECSVVTIGAHETALIKQGASGGRKRFADMVKGKTWVATEQEDKGMLYRLSVDAPEPELQAERWKAIPYSVHGETPKADEGAAWDGPAQVKAADVENMRYMSVFEDADNPDVKAGYKLPHHVADAQKPTAIWRGVAAAMGVLLGARGGVKGVSDAERSKGHAHLAKHYADFGKEAPELKAYPPEELSAMHDVGVIVIPGVAEKQTDEQRIQVAVAPLMEKIRELEARLDAQVREGETVVEAEKPVGSAPAAPTEVDLSDEHAEALRSVVKAVLQGDPLLDEERAARVTEAMKLIREGRYHAS